MDFNDLITSIGICTVIGVFGRTLLKRPRKRSWIIA